MGKKQFNGKYLKNARVLRGLTLTELANQTEISKQSISLYENEKNVPEYNRLSKLAKALNVPVNFFFQEGYQVDINNEVTYFRSLASTTKKMRMSQSTKLDYIAKMYEALLEYVDFPALNIPIVEFEGTDNEFDEVENAEMMVQIEDAARAVRNMWDLGDGPINDLQYSLEENGIIVTGFKVEDKKIDAFSQRVEMAHGDIYFIAVAIGAKPEVRIRFDMAHELGHILLHPWSENLELIPKDEFKAREKQANMFASALLLPKERFINDVQQYPTDLKYYMYLKKKVESFYTSNDV